MAQGPLQGYKSDLVLENLIPIGTEFSPSDFTALRRRARHRDPRYWWDALTELLRLGPGPQITKATEAMRSSTPQFITRNEDWNDDRVMPEDANPDDVNLARACRDYIEETLTPHLADLIGINGAGQNWFGIGASRIVLDPVGNMGRYDAIEAVEEIPQRRFRIDSSSLRWMLMMDPLSFAAVPVDELALGEESGRDGVFFTEIGANSVHLDQRGLLSRVYMVWNIEQFAMRWYAAYVMQRGNPPMWINVDWQKPEWIADAKASLEAMGNGAKGVYPLGTVVNSLPPVPGTNNPFDELISLCHRMYDAVFLGNEQGSGVQRGTGGKTQGDEPRQQFEDITNSRLRVFSPQIDKGLSRPLIARRFGARAARYFTPQIKLRFQDRDDPTTLATNSLNFQRAGFGPQMETTDILRRAGYKIAGPDDSSLPPVSAPMPGGMPAIPAMNASAEFSAKDGGTVPNDFGSTIRDHYRKILAHGGDLHAIKHRIAKAGKPDLHADADEMAAATLKATIEGMLAARKPRNVSQMRKKA